MEQSLKLAGRLRANRAAWARAIGNTLLAMVGEVETENGLDCGIDLGSRFDDSSIGVDDDRSGYRRDLAALVKATSGWEIVCHSMVSSGYPVRRFYLARRSVSE